MAPRFSAAVCSFSTVTLPEHPKILEEVYFDSVDAIPGGV